LRQATLVRSQNDLRDLSVQLKGLMNDPDLPPGADTQILPADGPVEVPIQLNFREQLIVALDNRPGLRQQEFRIDSARVIIKAADNNALPQLDLTFSVGYEGIGFTFSDTFDSLTDGHLINYAAGFQFELPIGNR